MAEQQSSEPSSRLSFSEKHRFTLFVILALVIHQLPFISIPFKWLESYFHEISHGIAALMTGGQIIQIQLFPNGAGLCTTRGGWSFLISFMGYAGAIFWGTLIYSIASIHKRLALIFSSLLLLLLVCSVIFWVRDLLTLMIVLILLVLFLVPFKFNKQHHLQKGLQLTGVMVLLNSIKSPFYLLDGRSLGDGATLEQITYLPEFAWVIIWSSLGLVAAYFLSKKVKS